MIISQNKVFNFFFYKRIRKVEEEVKIDFDNYFCDDIGLYAIYLDPNFEFNFVSLSDNKNWEQLALWTFRLSLFNLISTKSIQLVSFEDSKIFFNGLWKRNYKSFFFKVLNENCKGEDRFSSIILKIIIKANKDYKKLIDLRTYIRLINDFYLKKNGEYNKPEKRFIIELVKYYAKDHKWINIVSEKKLLGIYKHHKVELNRIHIPRLNIHHKQLEDYYNRSVLEHFEMRQFASSLREDLQNDFDNRHPKNDD